MSVVNYDLTWFSILVNIGDKVRWIERKIWNNMINGILNHLKKSTYIERITHGKNWSQEKDEDQQISTIVKRGHSSMCYEREFVLFKLFLWNIFEPFQHSCSDWLQSLSLCHSDKISNIWAVQLIWNSCFQRKFRSSFSWNVNHNYRQIQW